MNIEKPEYSYLLGFLHADGHLSESSRNRGKVSIELNIRDKDICKKFKNLIPFYSSISYRTRNTNFKTNYTSVVWSVYDLEFRKLLKSWGLTAGKKSDSITQPVDVSEVDYYRGLIDGDGSLGFTAKGFPFVSLVVSSGFLKDTYLKFLELITGKLKTSSLNKRDGIYNIVVYKEDAQALINVLYYEGCIALSRKSKIATKILNWKRPKGMKQVFHTPWTKTQDEIVLSNSVKEAAKLLNRTVKSVASRRHRLNHAL
jgi:hypothetical protein